MRSGLPASFSLHQRLRDDTRAAHRSLEAGVGFDIARPDSAVARHMLERFQGLVAPIEAGLERHLPASLVADRSKAELLRADLRRFGASPAAISRLRQSAEAAQLVEGPNSALGAMYVLEGSTLGGKMITKALQHNADWPITGRSYLNPYGTRTGEMWQSFIAYLNAIDDERAQVEIVDSANRCFDVIGRWMTRTDRAAA